MRFEIWILSAALGCTLGQTTPTPCNIGEGGGCPAHYCCTHDEFLWSLIYCKPYGRKGDSCVTKDSHLGCPCEPEFECVSTQSSNTHHVLYGKCQPKATTTIVMAAADDSRKTTPLLSVLLPKE
ncbi:hypothetical protein ACF0H5_007261 [Mactra antiquata]